MVTKKKTECNKLQGKLRVKKRCVVLFSEMNGVPERFSWSGTFRINMVYFFVPGKRQIFVRITRQTISVE